MIPLPLDEPHTCVPSHRINIPPGKNDPTYLQVGSPCNNYMGYCDVFNECRLANEDGPLSSIVRRIFFSDEPEIIDALKDWLQVRRANILLLSGLVEITDLIFNLNKLVFYENQ